VATGVIPIRPLPPWRVASDAGSPGCTIAAAPAAHRPVAPLARVSIALGRLMALPDPEHALKWCVTERMIVGLKLILEPVFEADFQPGVLCSRPTPHLFRDGFVSSTSRRDPHPPKRIGRDEASQVPTRSATRNQLRTVFQ
jgi:hypothetical protein